MVLVESSRSSNNINGTSQHTSNKNIRKLSKHSSSTKEISSSYNRHKSIQKERLPCNFCSKKFEDKHLLKQHLKTHRNQCTKCLQRFKTSDKWHQHEKQCNRTLFKCHICNHFTPTKCKLEIHMRMHTGERPFKCDLCPKTYKQISHKNEHMRKFHKPNL